MIPKLILYYGSLTVCGGGLVFIRFSGTGVSTVNASVMIAGEYFYRNLPVCDSVESIRIAVC
jgi:hypothetical protein